MNSPQIKWWFLQVAIFLFAFFFLNPQHLHAQQQQSATCQDWTAVQSWSGTITVSGAGQYPDQYGGTVAISENATITFTTNTVPPNCFLPVQTNVFYPWIAEGAQATYSVSVHDQDSKFSCGVKNGIQQFAPAFYDITNGTPGSLVGPSQGPQVIMNFSSQSAGVYTIDVAGLVTGMIFSTDCPASFVLGSAPWGPVPGAGSFGGRVEPPIPLPLPSTVSALTGSVTFQAPSNSVFFNSASTVSWTVSWNIVPTSQYDIVITTLPDYPSWRPIGGRSEKDFGNALIVTAQIVSKVTGQPLQVTPDKWTLALKDFSSEPGVTLNWPSLASVANPSPPDLDFKDPSNSLLYPNIRISPDGRNAQIVPGVTQQGNLNFVELILDSHDWGGWATLNVSATVAGQTIRGHFKDDPNTDILLPKRQGGSHIADIWKTQHEVALSTPDSDDSESSPQGDGQPGDGFTLYEEYRGFYMGCSNNSNQPQPEGSAGATCQHVEGDPGGKDLFIVDKVGASAGIKLFQAGSDLNVHFSGLKLAEVAPQGKSYRVINFNYGQGAHEVDQHALVMEYGTDKGFSEVVTTRDYPCPDGGHSCPALPKHIDHVALNANFKTKPGAINRVPAYRSDVAHEIAHAVDVYHHGDADAGVVWWQPDPNTGGVTEESLDQSHFPVPSTDRAIYVMAEDKDPSLLANALSAKFLHVPSRGMDVYVGNTVCSGVVVEHGQHSGDEASFMRYHYASAYIPLGFPKVRVLVEELPGVDLTDHPVGTGVNDPNRQPRPRYGDADIADLRGNDASQVDVSDNHNEIIRPSQACP